jgi:hypothetical protein
VNRILVGALLCLLFAPAEAAEFMLRAKSGASTRIHTYKSWKTDCTANVGVVKLLVKPTHGKLATSAVDTTINVSRHDPAKTAHCVGRPISGFRIDYTPDAGFRGRDTFLI